MKPFVHLSVAIFTGLLAPDMKLGVFVAMAQLLPFADGLLKYIFAYKPLHTVWGFAVMGFIYEANLPFIYLYLLLSYLLHLVLDVQDGIEPFMPWSKKQIRYPVNNGERIVLIVSLAGIVLSAVVKLLY